MRDHLCPVCGFDLGFAPWRAESPSDEICPSCGIQFGCDDAQPQERQSVYSTWRQRWIDEGMKWSSLRPPPQAWNPAEQLRNAVSGARPTELMDILGEVNDALSFLQFVRELRLDLQRSPQGWENPTLPQFLEAAEAWANDSSFSASGRTPTWRQFAEFLYAGKVYE